MKPYQTALWSCERDLKGRAQAMTERSLTEAYGTRRGEPMANPRMEPYCDG